MCVCVLDACIVCVRLIVERIVEYPCFVSTCVLYRFYKFCVFYVFSVLCLCVRCTHCRCLFCVYVCVRVYVIVCRLGCMKNLIFFVCTIGTVMCAVSPTKNEWEYVERPMEHFCELLGWKNLPHIDERGEEFFLLENSAALNALYTSIAHWRPKLRPSNKKIRPLSDDEGFDEKWGTWFSNIDECTTIMLRYVEETISFETGMYPLCMSLRNPTFEKLLAIYDKSIFKNRADETSFVLVQLLSYMYTNMFEDNFIGRIEASAMAAGLSKWELTASAFESFASMSPQSQFATLDEMDEIQGFMDANPDSGIVALFFAGLQLNAKLIDLLLEEPIGSIHAGNIMKDPFCSSVPVSNLIELATSIIDLPVGHLDFPNAITLITQMAPHLGYSDAENTFSL